MGTSVSGNPPLTAATTPTTRKRPRPPPLPFSPAPDSNPNPNSKQQRHLDLIPSPAHLETPPPTNPNTSLLHSDSGPDSSPPLIRPTSPEHSLIPNPNPNPNPNPTSVPSSLPMASLADLESSLDMAESPPNSPGCTSEEADLVIAEMMQSLVRVIENAAPAPPVVKPPVESSRSLAAPADQPESQGIDAGEEEEIAEEPEVVALDPGASAPDWAVEEEFGENCYSTLVDHNDATVDASEEEEEEDETAKLKGSLGPVLLLSSDLQRMLEASDAELGIVETASAALADDEEEVDEQSAAAAAACGRAEELDLVHELADAAEEEGGGVVVNASADLVEEWGRMISSSSSSSSTSSSADSSRKFSGNGNGNGNGNHANGALDEEIIDLYDEPENLDPWDLDPDVLDSIDEAWGRDGELDLLLISRELNSSVV